MDLEGTAVLLVRPADRVYAVEAICPHQGGVLADGQLDGERLRCPLHGATFEVPTGRVLADPDGIVPPQGGVEALAAFPVRLVNGMVEVELP